MKQVKLTPELQQKLQSAAGADVDVSKHKVFEAVGLNTQPVRKEHPLYKGGRHSPAYLQQMADQLNAESLPLQVMHDDQMVPVGRVFYGAVGASPTGPELRTLFWVDPACGWLIDAINSGTLNQVSVSTLSKDATCSVCGWDFLGPESDIDHVFSGMCGNGHQIGVDGAHAAMNNLDQWFEMSLVGRGGATGAFICSPTTSVLTNDFRLAASGKAASWLTLSLSSNDLEKPMTLEELAATLQGQFTALKSDVAALKASAAVPKTKSGVEPEPDTNAPTIGDLQAQVADLQDQIKKMTEVTTAPIPETPKGHTDDAGNFLLDGSPANALAKKILVMCGDVEAKLPATEAEALTLLETKLTALKASAAPAHAREAAAGSAAVADSGKPKSNAFKTAR
jgi:hypothetical protein